MKIAITDVETTGLDCNHNEMVSIGCVIFDKDTFEIEESFELKIKIEFPERMHPMAQKCNGWTEEAWKDAIPLVEAMQIYSEKVKGAHFSAQNMLFDHGFITEGFKKSGVKPSFGLYRIDLLTLAWSKIPHSKMTGWSLKKICEALEIPPEPEIHTGLNGAMCAYECYKKLMS